jgi:hypothetical protein
MLTQSWAKWIQSTPSAPKPFSPASTSIFSYLCLASSGSPFLSRSSIEPHMRLYSITWAMHVHQLIFLDLMCHAMHVIFVYGGLLNVSTVRFTLRILADLAYNLRRKHNFALLQNNYPTKRYVLKNIWNTRPLRIVSWIPVTLNHAAKKKKKITVLETDLWGGDKERNMGK